MQEYRDRCRELQANLSRAADGTMTQDTHEQLLQQRVAELKEQSLAVAEKKPSPEVCVVRPAFLSPPSSAMIFDWIQ